MKYKKHLKLIFKLTALVLTFAGLTSFYIKEGIWQISLGVGLIYEIKKLK
tara:strand:- start:245 stop:394 length:150 start_codon:yes stop_codon:yes gene_type:complete